MPAPDQLVAATAGAAGVLVRAAVTTELCETARLVHRASPTATAALGRALTGALLLGSLLKDRQSILLQWRGDGPLGPVVAEGLADLRVRGYVARPEVDLPSRAGKLDVGGGIGAGGDLVVVKDLALREPYVSTVPLQTGEIGDDLAYYLLMSEQVPAAVGLGVHVGPDYRVTAAGGVLVETLPGASPELVDQLAENMGDLGSVTQILLRSPDPAALVAAALRDVPHRTNVLGQPLFSCPCGPDRLNATLAALGPEEVRRAFEEDGGIRARCAFCATEWLKSSSDAPWERWEPG